MNPLYQRWVASGAFHNHARSAATIAAVVSGYAGMWVGGTIGGIGVALGGARGKMYYAFPFMFAGGVSFAAIGGALTYGSVRYRLYNCSLIYPQKQQFTLPRWKAAGARALIGVALFDAVCAITTYNSIAVMSFVFLTE